jgi:hypothetical protein
MPPKRTNRQTRLPFGRDRPIEDISTLDTTSTPSPAPSQALVTPGPSASASPAPSTEPPSRIAIRTSWVFHHMPDDDMQTRYFNPLASALEWRCAYYTQVYALSESVSGPSGHLQKLHKLENGPLRSARAQNVQYSLEQGFVQAALNPQKRKRADTEAISQDRLESLWVRCLSLLQPLLPTCRERRIPSLYPIPQRRRRAVPSTRAQ